MHKHTCGCMCPYTRQMHKHATHTHINWQVNLVCEWSFLTNGVTSYYVHFWGPGSTSLQGRTSQLLCRLHDLTFFPRVLCNQILQMFNRHPHQEFNSESDLVSSHEELIGVLFKMCKLSWYYIQKGFVILVLGTWSNWQSACHSNVRTWVRIPTPI